MSSDLQEILNLAKAKYGVTDPSLYNKKAPDEVDKLWIKAKSEVVKKSPLEWFEFVLNENLNLGLEQIKTISDLKHFHYMRDHDDVIELDRLKQTFGHFSMTVEIDKNNPPKSGVILHNPKTSQAFRYPDWDSYKGLCNEDKKEKKYKI